ncbi:MAG TPA: hypothetical protein VJT78_13920 [Candidatus Dormibacteraeota bacterium]|nr:hypothetical protein [Candidatus Dormibacteraeota bacterium]
MGKRAFRSLLVALAAVSIAFLPLLGRPVHAATSSTGTLFGVTQSQHLVKVDPSSGSLTLVADLNTPNSPQIVELASDPTTRKLYAERVSTIGFDPNGFPIFALNLLTIDSQTGAILAQPQLTAVAQSLVFDTASHTLFGFDFQTGDIVKVDPNTAAVTPFATVPVGSGTFIDNLAGTSSTHTLYLAAENISFPPVTNTPTQIFSIDTLTAQVSTGVVLDSPVRQIVADGPSLFGIRDDNLDMLAINLTTGSTSFVASARYSAESFFPAGPTVDPTTHTVFVASSAFDPVLGFQTHVLAINDQTGTTTASGAFNEFLTQFIFEAAPPITPQTIKSDVRSALATGAIDSAGVANSLLAKLNAAADARSTTVASVSGARTGSGCKVAANLYQAFIREVMAQSASRASGVRPHIAPATASELIGEAKFLIANCP